MSDVDGGSCGEQYQLMELKTDLYNCIKWPPLQLFIQWTNFINFFFFKKIDYFLVFFCCFRNKFWFLFHKIVDQHDDTLDWSSQN